MAKKDTANKPEVSDDIVTRVGEDKLSDLKGDSENFFDELKHNFGVNIYDALKEVGWIDSIAKTQIGGLDPKSFFEAIEYKLIDAPREELETFRDALEDNLSEQFENIPYIEDIETALKEEDPEAYLKDKVTTKVGELETGAKNKAIDFVIDSLDLPINLTRTARGVLFDKDIYSGDNLTINYSGGKPFDGDYSQAVNYRYTNKDGKWGDVDLSSDRTSTYEYSKGPIDFSLSRRPKGDTRGEFRYSQDFDFGNKGKFGIEASINDLLQTNIALGYRYESPRTGAWFKASYNPNNPTQQEFKFDTPVLTPNGYIDSQMINNSFNFEFGIPLGAGRSSNRSLSSYSPRSDVEQTIYRPSTAYKGPTINPETGLEEFNLKQKNHEQAYPHTYGDAIEPKTKPPTYGAAIEVEPDVVEVTGSKEAYQEYKRRVDAMEKYIADNRLVSKEARMSQLSGEGYRDPRIVGTTGVEAIDNFAVSSLMPTDYKEGRVVGQRLTDKDMNPKYYWDDELSIFFPEGMDPMGEGGFTTGSYRPLDDTIQWLGPTLPGKRAEQISKATQIHELVHRAAYKSGYMFSDELEEYLNRTVIFNTPESARNPWKTTDTPMTRENAIELVSEVLAHSYQPELKGKENKKDLEDAIRFRAKRFGIEDEYGINRLIDSVKPLQKSFIKYLEENPEPQEFERVVDRVNQRKKEEERKRKYKERLEKELADKYGIKFPKQSINPETGLQEFNLRGGKKLKKYVPEEVGKEIEDMITTLKRQDINIVPYDREDPETVPQKFMDKWFEVIGEQKRAFVSPTKLVGKEIDINIPLEQFQDVEGFTNIVAEELKHIPHIQESKFKSLYNISKDFATQKLSKIPQDMLWGAYAAMPESMQQKLWDSPTFQKLDQKTVDMIKPRYRTEGMLEHDVHEIPNETILRKYGLKSGIPRNDPQSLAYHEPKVRLNSPSTNPATGLQEFNLEKSNVSMGLQKLTGIANQPPQNDVEMQEDIERIEDKGRKGDTALVHVTPGEMIITPEMVNDDPEFRAVLEKKYAEYGIDPGQATVGNQRAATNTSTGLEEFNLLSPSDGSMARSPTTRRNSMKVDATSGTRAMPMVYQPESIDTMGQAFSAGVNSGWNNIKAQNKNMRAALAALRGDDVAERNFLREGNILEEQSGLSLAGLDSTFASAIEEGNIHDFFLNAASATGQFIPSLAASLAEAIVVGGVVVGGTVLSRGTATPALLTTVGAATTARRATMATKAARSMQRTRPGMDKMDVEDLLSRAYRNQVQVQKGKTPNFTFTPQELQDLDDLYGVLRSMKRSRRFTQGAVLGAYSQEQRMGTGIAYSDYADQGMGGTDGAIKSILQGQVFGAIGVGSEIAVAGITLKRLRQSRTARKSKTSDPFKFEAVPPHSMFKDFATITAVTGTSEALAESLQEELSVQQKLKIDDDYTKEQAQVDRVNAFFAGLMGGIGVGGGLGSGTAVMNKVRNYHARNIADREMFKILSDRENLAKIGRVMAERPKAIRGQFADMKNQNSAIDSVFVDIDSKKAWIKEQGRIEKMFGADELISVATPTGAFFTTNPRKATRLANIMDSGYKFHTGILEDFLADALGYSRSRDPGDDVVVGLYNEKIQEFTKYQSAQENVEGDVEAAKAAMNKLRMALDPKQYTIKVQTLAQHRRFRQKGVDKGTTPASVRKELYQTDETMSEMNTDQDDRGVEGDRGRADPNVSAANIDIRRGKIDRQTREAFDAYIQEDYKLPINYSDLVFFVENSKKLVRAKDKKQIQKTLGKDRQRYLQIYKDLTNAESMGRADIFTQEDRQYLQRISTDFTSLVSSMEDLLEELAVTGQALQQEDSIGSSIARDEFGSREVMSLPLVGVSEVLTRTNITGTKEDQKTARAPIKENDPTVMKRGGSGTAQNPFIDPTKIKGKGGIGTKGFRISKEDPKAHGNSVNGINSLIHATLKEEFNAQKPFLTKGAIEMFKRRNAETQQNTQFEFLRFVDTRDLNALRTATAANESFVAPQRDPKKDAKRSYVIVRMKPEAEQFREVTRENVDIFRNVKEDLTTRFEQAYQRTRGKNYKDDVYFYIQNLDPAAKSKVARPVDMSVLIEGVSRLSKILGRRDKEEFTNPQAQRLSAFIDTIDLLNENNYRIEYEPYAQASKESNPENRFTIADTEYRPLKEGEVRPRKPEVGPPSPIIKVNKVLDAIATDPFGAGESILKIRIPKYEHASDPAARQIRYLRKQFGLVKLAKDYYTRDLFSEVNTPFVQLLDRLGQSNPTIDTSTVLPILKNIKQTNMAEMSLEQLEDLQDTIEDVLTVDYGIIDTGAFTNYALSKDPNTKITPGLMLALKKKGIAARSETAKKTFGKLVRQDGTLVALLTEISKIVSAINAQDIRNNPGVLVDSSRPLGQPGAEVIPGSKRVVKPGETTTTTQQTRTELEDLTGFEQVGRLETETIPGKRIGRPSKQPEDGIGPPQPAFVQEPGQEFTQLVTEKETKTTTPTEVAFDYKGAGNIPATYKPDRITGSLDKSPAGTINRDAPIGTYIDDIAQITMERATAALDDSGLYMTDDPAMGAPVDNSAIKMDIRDRNLFESYQEQQGKEYRGRDKYADMSRVTEKGTKPKLKDFKKYDKRTQLFLTRDSRVIKDVEDNFKQALKDRAKKMGAGTSVTRAKLPFRKQIVNNLIAGARQLGLQTNLKIIAAETSFVDSQLPTDIKETIDQEQFEQKRQELLDQTDKAAKTLSYQDFDVILMKTSDVMSEGQYYSAFLKELGNSLTFQELERSIKVPAVRKKLLQDFEKKLEGENVPENYKGDDGFENFLADQWSIEIRKTLGLEVDGTAYDSMSGPTKAWFKRLTNSQRKLYNKLSPAQRKRLQIDETFEEYAADLRDAVANPEAQKINYKTKAKIESQIENILGPETATDKELRKLMRQAQSILRSRKLPKWMQKVFLSSDTRMRNYTSHPTAGEELANFWNQDPRTVSKSGISGVYTRKNRRANALHNTAAKKLGVQNGWLYSKLSDDQKKSVDLAADDTKDANVLTPEAQAVRKFLQDDVYKKLNLERFGVANRKNFFPRDVLVAEIAGNEALQEKTREVLQKYNPKATKKQIDKDVAYLIKSGDGGLEITADSEIEVGLLKDRKKRWSNVPNKALMDAGLAAPAEVALQKYLANVAMKYEFEQSGGKRALDRILNKLNEAEREDAKKIIASMNGKTPPIENGLLKVFNNVMLPLNVITLLAFTVLASLQDTAGPILRSRGTAKISDVSKVIKDMMKNPTQAADFAREIGVIGVDAMSSFFIYAGEQNFMNQTAKDVSDVWFRITGLEAYTKFTRVFAVGMGTRFLQDHARKAKEGDETSQLYLKELNVTADQVLAWEKGKANKATRELVNTALAQFVDESIVRPNPAQRPTYANDPRWATIWQLKSFFYAYGKTIVFPTLKEAHRGFVNQGMGAAAMPLLLMAGILIPITMLGLEIREATKAMLAWLLPGIAADDPGVNYYKSDKMSTGEYMTEIIDRSGMLGPLSLALPIFSADHRYGKPFWVPPLGPTAERIYDARPWDFETRAVDFIPVYSQLDTRALGR